VDTFDFPVTETAPVVEIEPEPETPEPVVEEPVAVVADPAPAATEESDEPVQLSQEDEDLLAAMQADRPAAGQSIEDIFAKTTAKLTSDKPGSSPAADEKKKRKKKKFRELDYDPDTDTTIPRVREDWEED